MSAAPGADLTDAASMRGGPLLVLAGVRRTHHMGDEEIAALDGIDLTIMAGEFVAIVGPSGSGKSTLLNILGCLDQPTDGSYRIDGRETRSLDADALASLRRHTFGFVFQEYNLLPRMSARDNVELPAVYAGEPRATRRVRADALLDRLGLGDRRGHRPSQLSGGQQQRVGIARALVNGGLVLLADEPTGALDSRTGDQTLALFRTLCDEGHTVLMVTHDQHVAAQADRIVEMVDGRIRADRTVVRRDLGNARPTKRKVDESGWIRYAGDALRNAAHTIVSHRLRNALTMLGIVVGIASVILSVAFGEGSQRQVLREIESLGASTIQVAAGRKFQAGGFSRADTLDIQDIKRFASMPFLVGATPVPSMPLTLHYANRAADVFLFGVSASFFQGARMPTLTGETFKMEAVNRGELQVVISARTRDALFPPGQDAIGSILFVYNMPARVVAIVQPTQTSRYDDQLFAAIPYTTYAYRLSGRSFFPFIFLHANEAFDETIVVAAVEKLLRSWHRRKDFDIFDLQQAREQKQRVQKVLSLVTGFVAGVALLIAGIGVTNMMLVSVVERTREIGILMAIGARRLDIMLQFLVEAILLCVGGGVLGTLLAYALGETILYLGVPLTLEFSWRAIVAAILCSSVSGIAAGVLPARRAARINPVEALAR